MSSSKGCIYPINFFYRVMTLPFEQQKISENSFIRKFSSDTEEDELYWHRDKANRVIKVISGSNWMYQEEDCLPIELYPGLVFSIQKETWHRVIRGSGDLEIFIEEER